MRFTKMHGCANDYIYVYTGTEHVEDELKPLLAKRLSDRHTGIGSDGLIFINPTDRADFEMEMYNSDGSRGAMCGNGIRCVGKFVYDQGLTDKSSFDILTGSGVKHLEVDIKSNKVVAATVNMGSPILEPDKIPVAIKDRDNGPIIGETIEAGEGSYRITCVSMGNPHCVIFMNDNIRELDLERLGPVFEHHVIFPDRVNTEFVNVLDRTHLSMRVWERGAGETMACGTGACACTVAGVLNGLCEREVNIKLLGGELDIRWDEKDGNVYMTGPCEEVFRGEVDIKQFLDKE